jgi:hypothetical protein
MLWAAHNKDFKGQITIFDINFVEFGHELFLYINIFDSYIFIKHNDMFDSTI